MRLTSKGNRSRHAKAGADGVDGREDERAGGKFWTGWEGSAALGRSRHGRVRMMVEKKILGLEAGAGLAGWLDSQRAPAVSGWRQGARGPSVFWGSLEHWYRGTWGTWVHAGPKK